MYDDRHPPTVPRRASAHRRFCLRGRNPEPDSFSLVPALLPQFIVSWSLSNAEAGWLAGMMSAGYMAAVLPLVALTDRMPARMIFLASSALNALSCFGIAFSDGLIPALIWRAVSGVAVAGMYMPGLRALTDGMAGASRARAAAWYTSSFTLGSSLSFLLGQAGLVWDWRGAFVVSGALSVMGVLLAWEALRRMNTELPAERPRGVPNFQRGSANRDVLVLTLGYTATIWGTAGLRQWIVVFLTFCAANQGGGATEGWSMLITGGLAGRPGGLVWQRTVIAPWPAHYRHGRVPGISAGERIIRLRTDVVIWLGRRSRAGCRLRRARQFLQSHLGPAGGC
jgi:predicted MFS family arabinose efflux permease